MKCILRSSAIVAVLVLVEGTTSLSSSDSPLSRRTVKCKSCSKTSPISTPEPVDEQLFEEAGSNDDTFLEAICEIYIEYVDTAETSLGTSSWSPSLCNQFYDSNNLLCPNNYEISKICAQASPYLATAVRQAYCAPLFSPLVNEDYQEECITYCTDFVSKDLGHCCPFECSL